MLIMMLRIITDYQSDMCVGSHGYQKRGMDVKVELVYAEHQ